MAYVQVRAPADDGAVKTQRVIDLQSADDGAVKTQETWILYFNELEKLMISAPDGYRIGKSGTPELVESVRYNCNKSRLVLSTRHNYNPDTLDARIVHDHGSTRVQPTERRVLVPFYQNAPLPEVLGTAQGIAYLRAYFDTKDDPDEIKKTLVNLSGLSPNLIQIWAPDQPDRLNYQERAAVFGFVNGRFRINGPWLDYNLGHSRGVSNKVGEADAQK